MDEGRVICNVAARTDVGMVRTNNEDNMIMADLTAGQSLPESCQLNYKLDENSLLLVVSDGMGGAEFGEVASELTVLAIKDVLVRLPKHISTHDRLVAAVEEANNIVWNEGIANPNMKGMGATVTAALIEGDRAFIAEVGDSRAYLIRAGNIKQVTTDQSFVAQLISKGLLKPEDAVQHPRKNVILQSIGAREAVQVAVSMFQLHRGDSLLLCSDGLSNLVNKGEMLHFSTHPPEEACKQLIDLAKQRGGQDNITVILAKFDGDGLIAKTESAKLTGLLQTLSSYDPEQQVEKSHKRTQLLGDSSISSRYYGPSTGSPKLEAVTTLGTFPNSAAIRQECHRMIELLDFSHQFLEIKYDQVEQASQWLETQGAFYVNHSEMLKQIQAGLEHIEKAKQIANDLVKVFENPDTKKS